MFGIFGGDKTKRLKKQLRQKSEEAMRLQRSGDMKGFAAKTAEADALEKELRALEG